MDEDQIHRQVKKCNHLKFKFRGVYAADNFPLNLQTNTFIIVIASRSNSIGTHWVVLSWQNRFKVTSGTVEERLFAVKVLIDFAGASLKGAGSCFWFLVTEEEEVDFERYSTATCSREIIAPRLTKSFCVG